MAFGGFWGSWEEIGRRFYRVLGGLEVTGKVLEVSVRGFGGPRALRTPRDAAGRRPQQGADGDQGRRVGLRLPGAGARLLPVQEVRGGSGGHVPPPPEHVLAMGPPAQCHPLFSAQRAPEPAAAAAPPRGLRPSQGPPTPSLR